MLTDGATRGYSDIVSSSFPSLWLWVVAGVALNRGQAYPVTTSDVITALALLGGLAAGALALSRRVPYVVRVAGVVTSGVLRGARLPATLAAHDTVAAITEIARTATGGGVNSYSDVETGSPRDLFGPLLRQTTVLYALAVVAALARLATRRRPARRVAARRNRLGAMALARLGTPQYFAPSFLLSVLAVAWLCSRVNRVAGLILAGALAVWIVGVQFRYGTETRCTSSRCVSRRSQSTRRRSAGYGQVSDLDAFVSTSTYRSRTPTTSSSCGPTSSARRRSSIGRCRQRNPERSSRSSMV